MEKVKFVHVSYIVTTPEKLWEALTNNEFIRQYWGDGLTFESDWKTGSPINHYSKDGKLAVTGKIIASDPPRTLSFIWGSPTSSKDAKNDQTKVTYELVPQSKHVRLMIIHEGLKPGEEYRGAGQAWSAIVSGLKTMLETGRAVAISWDVVHGPEGAML